MKFESFLENLYFGHFNRSRFHYSESSKEDPVVADILTKYIEATADYPPEMLESLGKVPDELLERLRKIGFFGLYIPKNYGGVGLTLYQYLALVKEIVHLDMALGILALAHLSIGMKAILLFGNEDQKRRYLPLAASGAMIFCYALTEPLIGSDAKNINTAVELSADGKHFILNGTKTFITNPNYSGGFTVFAQMDRNKKGSLGAFIVESAWKGVTIGKDMDKMGLKASSTASIQFSNVLVPVENLIGNPGDGFKIAMTVLNYGRLALGAASSGMLEISYFDMLKRSKARVQFEKPIFEYELIQEKIIRAFVENEAVWAMTNFTTGLLEEDMTAYVAIESSHCKLYGTNKAWDSLYDAMQTAGGAGYLKGQPYEKRMRDFRVGTIFEGTTEIHSIYPPVSILRTFAKQAFKPGSGPVSRMFAVLGARLAPSTWSTSDKDPLVRNAYKRIKRYSRLFRNLFLSALSLYGKTLPDKEFLLRRMTVISYTCFALIAMTAKLTAFRGEGKNADLLRQALKYYMNQADITVKASNRLAPDKLEKAHKKLIDWTVNH